MKIILLVLVILLALEAPSASAGNFAVLAGTAVTCTNSTVSGDVGVFPGTAVTQTSCTMGSVHAGDGVAQQAQADFLSAYAALADRPCGATLTGTLAGVTLTPGVYCFGAATLTGVVTLDGQGDANSAWIFRTDALTGTDFSVVMSNGGQPCNVFWRVAGGATLTTSNFQGSVLASAAITVTGGTFHGNALAQAAVTLTGTTVTPCAQTIPPPPPTLPPPPPPPPIDPLPTPPLVTLPSTPVPTEAGSTITPAGPTAATPASGQPNASTSATPVTVTLSPTPSRSPSVVAAVGAAPSGPLDSVGPFGLSLYTIVLAIGFLAALSLRGASLFAVPRGR